MLDRDLELAASDGGVRLRAYNFGRELNRRQFATCPWTTDRDAGASCTATPARADHTAATALFGAALAGLAIARYRRRAPRV
jgi:hypothetical protein